MEPTVHLYMVVVTIPKLLAEQGRDALYCSHIARAAKLQQGTVHQILQRLVSEGFLRAEQEKSRAGSKLGHSPRVFYRLTPQWEDKARLLIDDMRPGQIRRARQLLGG